MPALLKISTSSEVIRWPITVTPHPPTITLGGELVAPDTPPTSPTGFQVVVIDTSVNPPTYTTQYVQLSTASANWMRTAWEDMYSNLQTAVGSASKNQIVVVASYGMDQNLCPTGPVLKTLENAGAQQLQNDWVDPNEKFGNCGSEVDNPIAWISIPISYIFIGSLSTTEAVEGLLLGSAPLELRNFV